VDDYLSDFRDSGETPESNCEALLQPLHRLFRNFGATYRRGRLKDNFQMSRDLLCYCRKGTRRRRWIVPLSLRPMFLKYFHNSLIGTFGRL
jgi:hypothetical protein